MDRPGLRTGDARRDRAAFRARRAGIDRHRFPAPCAAKAVAAAAAPAFLTGTPGKRGGQHSAWHPRPHRGKGTKRLAEMTEIADFGRPDSANSGRPRPDRRFETGERGISARDFADNT